MANRCTLWTHCIRFCAVGPFATAAAGALVIALLTLPAYAAGLTGKTQSLTSPDQVPEGLATSDWSSIRAAYEAGQHAFQPTPAGWQARNPGQQWTTSFDRRGFLATPRDGAWTWGLELVSYGFGDEQTAITGTPAVKAEGQRLSYQWDAHVQEWFINDPRGLEHGFTINERPAAAPSLNAQDSTLNSGPATLRFHLAPRGTLTPCVSPDGLGVLFRDSAGATVLNYSGLKVWDADGKVLSSRFELADAQPSTLNIQPVVRLLVDERGARYPLTIDPIAQQAYLKPAAVGTTQAGDTFGVSVAVSGDTVVIGASTEDSSTTGVNTTPNESAVASGAAYVFVRSGTTWTQQAYLKASNAGAGDKFGASVSVSGDTVVVGAWRGVNLVYYGLPNDSAATSGRPTCSCAVGRRGPRRPISTPATPGWVTSSASRWRCRETRWSSGPGRRTAARRA